MIATEPTRDLPRLPRLPGRLKGIIEVPTDEEWAAMDKELEELMVSAPLSTDGDVRSA